VSVPVVVPAVKVTEHEPDTKVHVAVLNVPKEGACVQVTVPVGVVVGAGDVSVTVAVQVLAPPVPTVLGVQVTPVADDLLLTVMLEVPELVACIVLPP